MKILNSIVISFFLFFPFIAFGADNNYSTSLSSGSFQYWSITNDNQQALDLDSGDFSIMAWIKPDYALNNYPIINKKVITGGYSLVLDGINKKLTILFANESSVSIYNSPNNSIANNVWQHIVVTCNVSTPSCNFFIDSIATTSTQILGLATSTFANNSDFRIGNTVSGYNFNGLIDEVIITSDIISQQEISDYYDCGIHDEIDNIAGHWKFENNALDETANNNDLTNNNSATFQSASLPFTDDCTPTSTSTATTTLDITGSLPIYNDITIVTGYEEIYTDTSTSPSEIRYKTYHIPAIFVFFLVLIFMPIILRIILEVIIWFRQKND